jgi:hypothetical protein
MEDREREGDGLPFGFTRDDLGRQRVDPGDFLRSGRRKDEGRDVFLVEIHAQGPDESGVGFYRVDGSAGPAPGRGLVVEKALGFNGVADFKLSAPQQRDPRSARAAVKIEKDVIPGFPDFPDETEKIAAVLFDRDDYNPIDIGISLDQAAVRLFDEIDHGRFRKTALEKGNGRGRQDDVAETAEAEKKDGTRIHINF